MFSQEALESADLTTVFDGLNALGRVPWKINDRILKVAQRCWDLNVPIGDIPSQTDLEVPPEPIPPSYPSEMLDKESPEFKHYLEEKQKYLTALTKYNRTRQKNMVSHRQCWTFVSTFIILVLTLPKLFR